jgi:hypothetical protein
VSFEYHIKPIPTTYSGVNFRSRLEARWAAFFDLSRLEWDYEPFDLEGWTPDFILRYAPNQHCTFLAEVKPIDFSMHCWNANEPFLKAEKFADKHNVIRLGISPIDDVRFGKPVLVVKNTEIDTATQVARTQVNPSAMLGSRGLVSAIIQTKRTSIELWREAGNIVQWNAVHPERDPTPLNITDIIKRGLERGKAARNAA